MYISHELKSELGMFWCVSMQLAYQDALLTQTVREAHNNAAQMWPRCPLTQGGYVLCLQSKRISKYWTSLHYQAGI